MLPTKTHSTSVSKGAGHTRWSKVTHWVLAASVLTLALSGFTILIAHSRLYWGAAGNDLTPALIELPISRNYGHGGWGMSTPAFPTADLGRASLEAVGIQQQTLLAYGMNGGELPVAHGAPLRLRGRPSSATRA
jgi:hypothetical protein